MKPGACTCPSTLRAIAIALTLICVVLPATQADSCSAPLVVDPSSSTVYRNPCDYEDSTATYLKSDFVMLISSASTSREITVEASGIDTVLYAYTACPDSESGSSRVAYDDDGGSTTYGSLIVFTAEPFTDYYVVLEPYSDPDNCGSATVTFSSNTATSPSPSPAPPPTAPSPSPPPQSSPGTPPDTSTGCDSPTTISLARWKDYFTMPDDTCSLANTHDGVVEHEGVTYTLGSNEAVLKLSAAPETRAISVSASSSSFEPMVFVSRECSRSQTNDTKVAFEEGRTEAELSFVAEAQQAYYIVLESKGGCGPAEIRVENSAQRASGKEAATCEEPHSVSLGGTGGIHVDGIDTCAQANSMDGTITLGRSTETQLDEKDYIFKLEAYDSADREIRFYTGDTNYMPIVVVSEECSTSLDQVTMYDYIGEDERGATARTFIAKAGVAYYLSLEAIDSELIDYYDSYYDSQPSCGTEGVMELTVASSSPSLPQLQRTGKAKMKINAVVDASYNAVTQSSDTAAAFKDDISSTVARSLYNMEPGLLEEDGEACLQCVTCGALSSGSVEAPITVLFKDNIGSDTLSSFTKRVDGIPNRQLFNGSAYQDQVIRFEAIVEEGGGGETNEGSVQPADSGSDSSDPASVVAPAVVVPVVVVLVCWITWLYYYHDWRCSGWSCSSFWTATLLAIFSPFILLWFLGSLITSPCRRCCSPHEPKPDSEGGCSSCCSMDQCSACAKTAWAPFAICFGAVGHGCSAAGRGTASGFRTLGAKLGTAFHRFTPEGKRQLHDEQMRDMEQHILELEKLIKEDEQTYYAIKRENEVILRSQRARIGLSPEQERSLHQVLVRLETLTRFKEDKRGQLTHAQETYDHQRQAKVNYQHHKHMKNFKGNRGFKVSPSAWKKTQAEVEKSNEEIRQACNVMSSWDELARKHGVL